MHVCTCVKIAVVSIIGSPLGRPSQSWFLRFILEMNESKICVLITPSTDLNRRLQANSVEMDNVTIFRAWIGLVVRSARNLTQYSPHEFVAWDAMDDTHIEAALQQCYRALAGVRGHKSPFRQVMIRAGPSGLHPIFRHQRNSADSSIVMGDMKSCQMQRFVVAAEQQYFSSGYAYIQGRGNHHNSSEFVSLLCTADQICRWLRQRGLPYHWEPLRSARKAPSIQL